MALALQLGRRGLGQVWPNPAVGCVIIKDGRVVGRGFTQAGGRPHAETMALAQAGAQAHGATAYVTLEPCAHHGKTPPCAQALIDARVTRVVSALTDPDPRVAGKGHQMLEQAGIEVQTGVLGDRAAAANQGFLSRVTSGRPLVTLKLATTLDGKIATRTGNSQWITGPQARAYTHYLRARHDAIMIGSGTALADDPDLRVRHHGLETQSPVRVVLDSTLRLPMGSKLVASAAQTPVWICYDATHTPVEKWSKTAVTLLPCNRGNGSIDIDDVLQTLGRRGITRLFCEGGGRLGASLITARVVDRLIVMSAGITVGDDGLGSLASLGVDQLSEARRFLPEREFRLGPDLISQWVAA